jgi:DNA-directed RNA polymerase subunit omega
MNADLVTAAAKVIPNPDLLVNVVRLRVRQLWAGHRPLVQCSPGASAADIALLEIIGKKLTSVAAPKEILQPLPIPTVDLSLVPKAA